MCAVAVFGAGVSGICAALQAARLGKKTLLVEKGALPGGAITLNHIELPAIFAGKTNTIYPWGWSEENGEPDPYFHDIFHADGTPLYSEEVEFLSNINK